MLSRLQTATGDVNRSEAIFERIFGQAKALSKDSEWVAVELGFESLAQGLASRTELALLYLNQDDMVDDAALDLYNERLSRFSDTPF